MNITINSDILSRYNLTVGQFLILLMGYQSESYGSCYTELKKKQLVEPNLFESCSVVLSDKTKNFVANIIVESDDRIINSHIDFNKLAETLIGIYPKGVKPGTTYKWGSTVEDISQKLKTLFVAHDFVFTEDEAIKATEEYVNSFKDKKFMHLLRNFLLKEFKDEDGSTQLESQFMTIIENNRNEN